MPASIFFLGQKADCWDNSKFLKISAVLLTSAVVSGGDAFGFNYNGEEYYYIKNVQYVIRMAIS